MTIEELFATYLRDTGLVGLFMLLTVAWLRRWIVTGTELREMRKDRDEWRQLALENTRLAERAVNVAEPQVRRIRRRIDHEP